MNKENKSKVWRIVYIGLVALYFVVVFFSIRAIISIPKEYDKVQKKQTDFLQEEIKRGIKEQNDDIFKKIEEKYAAEFLVFVDKSDKIIYSTIPANKVLDIKGNLNKNAVAVEKFFNYSNNDVLYDIWLIQYNISPQTVVNMWLTKIIIIIFILVAVNLVAMSILFLKFIKPLKMLKENVTKISKFQLDLLQTDGNSSEYDQISTQLAQFAGELSESISASEVNYTALEQNLQIQNERLNYRSRMVAALTHDLKAPLNNVKLAISYDKNKFSKNQDIVNQLNKYQSSITKVIGEINDIGKLTYQDKNFNFMEKEEFDLIELLLESYGIFKTQFAAKGLIVNNDIEEKVMMYNVRLLMKQIIHNSLSNVAAYTSAKGVVEIICYKENGKIYLSFYNETKPLSDEQLDNIFKLFYRISKDSDGLGTGLFTIKNATKDLGGEVTLRNKDKGVILEFVFSES